MSAMGGILAKNSRISLKHVEASPRVANRCCRDCCVAIRDYLRLLARQERNFDHQLRDYDANMHRAADSSVFFCSRPIQTALSRKVFNILLICLSAMYLSITAAWARRVATGGSHKLRCFRFSCFELRDGSRCNGRVSLQRVGILHYESSAEHDEAGVGPTLAEEKWGNCTIDLKFPKPVKMNGFFFVTASGRGTESEDPVRFLLEGSQCDGRWKVVGASAWRYDWLKTKSEDLSVYRFWNGRYNITKSRGEMEVLAFHTPGLETLLIVLLNLCRTLLLGVPAMFGLLKREEQGKKAIQVGILCLVANLLALLCIDEENRLGMMTNVILSLSFFLSLRYFEDETLFWLSALVIFGSWCVLGYMIAYTAIFRVGLLVSLFSTCVLLYRDHVLSTSWNLVNFDRARYEEGWRLFLSRLEQEEEVKQLSKYLRHIVGNASIHSLQAGMVMRRWLKKKSFSDLLQMRFSSSVSDGVMQVDRDGVPVQSLHRLYSQAVCLQVVLAEKVRWWASQSRGYFVVQDQDGRNAFITCEEALALQDSSPTASSIIPLKSISRTIEKVARSYGGEVCRVLDISRARIVFDDIEGVSRCLSIIKNDRDVEILRLKGRMAQEQRADCEESDGDSFGRRDLMMNICIRNEETVCLGVENHIAEVQLQVITLAALQTSEAHSRYLTVRNLRRE